MLYKIVVLLLEVVTGLLTTTCLLRLYMQQQRIPLSARSGNPLGRFVFALTDWIVLPLRRVVPALGPWDMASLVAAFLIQLAHFGVLWALNGFGVTPLSIVVLALLVGALALYFFPRGEDRTASSPATAPEPSSAPDAVPTGAADAPAAERPSQPAPAPAATALFQPHRAVRRDR